MCSSNGCGAASNMRRSICELTKPSARRELRLAGISTSTTVDVHIRVLTAAPRIKPTSTRCHSAWQPKPGRGSTYRRGDFVQTSGTSSILLFLIMRCTPTLRELIEATPLSLSSLDRLPAFRLLLPRSGLERSDFVRWHIASFRCAAEFGRYRGIADSGKPPPGGFLGSRPNSIIGIVGLPSCQQPFAGP